MNHPIDIIRTHFPALHQADAQGQLPLLLDGPGGSQVPQCVLDALVGYLGRHNTNLGGHTDAGRHTQAVNEQARAAAADWLGCEPDEIVFGLNSTSLMFNLSRAVARSWQPGDNIVLSSLDHYSHVSSWQRAAEDMGVEVRMLPLNAEGSDLDYAALPGLLDARTRLLAFTLASNVLGTLSRAQMLLQAARAVGAWVSVDAVHAAVHRLPDIKTLDCDFLFASAYKLGGPHLGICYGKRQHWQKLHPYKVEPAAETVPNRWEQGTQSFEAQAGFTAMVDYWAGLSGSEGNRRERLQAAYQQVGAYEQELSRAVLQGLAERPYVRLYGLPAVEDRTPTFAFNIVKNGRVLHGTPVSQWFGRRNVALGNGNFYALAVSRHLGLGRRRLFAHRLPALHQPCRNRTLFHPARPMRGRVGLPVNTGLQVA